MTRAKKSASIIALILLFIGLITAFLILRENRLRRAEYKNGLLKYDNVVYEDADYREISPYEETYKVICKTTDGVWTIYEIAEFPNHEYVVARTGWEAGVLKRKD